MSREIPTRFTKHPLKLYVVGMNSLKGSPEGTTLTEVAAINPETGQPESQMRIIEPSARAKYLNGRLPGTIQPFEEVDIPDAVRISFVGNDGSVRVVDNRVYPSQEMVLSSENVLKQMKETLVVLRSEEEMKAMQPARRPLSKRLGAVIANLTAGQPIFQRAVARFAHSFSLNRR